MPTKTVSSARLKPGRADIFLPDELDTMFDGAAPQAGDVLLLDGDGPTSVLSRTAQGGSDYSHVGLVIGSDLYIDAVGREGVRIRRIADMRDPKHRYVLKRCKVARNRPVIATQANVWTPAMAYYERPYRLWSVLMKPGGAEVEDDPVICSKLVATIMVDMGFELPRPVQRTMPKHLAAECSGREWRQFPLLAYDLFAAPKRVASERKRYTEFWLEQVQPQHGFNKAYKALKKLLRK
jgi:hypothetical protein